MFKSEDGKTWLLRDCEIKIFAADGSYLQSIQYDSPGKASKGFAEIRFYLEWRIDNAAQRS